MSAWNITNVSREGGCQLWNCSTIVLKRLRYQKVDSKATQWSTKGIKYGNHTSISLSVSWRPHFPGAWERKEKLIVFFGVQGPLFIKFLERRGTVTSDVYCETLQSLRRSIKNKRQELLLESMFLLHNARPHVSSVTHAKRTKFNWEQLDHLSYSPVMSPCYFHVFGRWKNIGQRFNSDDEFKNSVKDEASSRPQKFW